MSYPHADVKTVHSYVCTTLIVAVMLSTFGWERTLGLFLVLLSACYFGDKLRSGWITFVSLVGILALVWSPWELGTLIQAAS